ncbi:hypothetical protein BH09ACT1_BH09ACT1_06920 [soil metagenome]
MRVRATVGGIFAATAILGIGWQFGSATVAANQAADTTGTTASANSSASASSPGTTATATPSASASASPSSASAATDGTFAGAVESTRFGNVQVEIVVSGGKITDVKALALTDHDGRSVEISNRAAPILRSEVLASQSAKVSSVSGATYTTDGYLSSVQSAIDKAGL